MYCNYWWNSTDSYYQLTDNFCVKKLYFIQLTGNSSSIPQHIRTILCKYWKSKHRSINVANSRRKGCHMLCNATHELLFKKGRFRQQLTVELTRTFHKCHFTLQPLCFRNGRLSETSKLASCASGIVKTESEVKCNGKLLNYSITYD